MSATRPEQGTVKILLVEDDEVDVMGIKRALRDLRISNPLIHAKDGIDALEHMRGENGHEKIQAPYIVLLDLNMPRMGGVEFLEVIRADPALRSTIVFVLTTSSADADIVAAYEQNVAGYIVKSDAKRTFLEAARLLDFYWSLVALPKQ